LFDPKSISHEGFGGIHPSVAIEAHQRNMVNAIFLSSRLL
jgi:tRNA A37 threonylcarbamoyltransferase TsaD